jgi:acetyl/propionyl-CoA carboxylase alpha subunit
VASGPGELPRAWQQAVLEAAASCRREGIYMEKYLERARHLEVQVAADAAGRVITFPTRDCSLQRRYQKWVEETPAPRLPAKKEEALRRDARRFIEACGLVGIATVEFLLEEDSHYFLEVNARLQVEHTVTELITGWDLVRQQLRLAAGESLPEEPGARGHAVQARLYLLGGSMQGKARLELPGGPGIRVDAAGSDVSLKTRRYDSLAAKVCAWAPTRREAVARMARALAETEVRGAESNLAMLRSLVASDAFRAGGYDSRSLEGILGG